MRGTAQPGPSYREIAQDGPVAERVILVRLLIAENLQEILDEVHEGDVIASGEQWTLPITMDCGFAAEIIVRVRSAGSCGEGSRARDR